MRRICLALVAVFVLAPYPSAQTPIFQIGPNRFWLNLHHFLYVLGRAEAQMPDRQRRAVAGAPGEQAAGMAALTGAEQQAWAEAVTAYASGWSRKDLVFDRDLVAITAGLQRVGNDASPARANVDAGTAAVLERAASIYRSVWWPAHQRANLEQLTGLQSLVNRDGAAILKFITRAYQQSWPDTGYPVNLSGYTNWAGAYSTGDQLLVVSSLDPGTKGMQGLEIVFHEAMHQWDDPVFARLQKLAAQSNIPRVHGLLTHAMIFYTAGEAVRSVDSAHVPYAELNGLWKQKGLGGFKGALDAAWKPYLDGKGTLDEALIALLKTQPAG